MPKNIKNITFFEVTISLHTARPSKSSINLLDKFMDTWYDIYQKDYNRTFNKNNGNLRAMINDIAKRKGTQQRIIDWMNIKANVPRTEIQKWLDKD